jgi:hypothetical protein
LTSATNNLALFLLAVFASSPGCTKREPIVVVDDWWNVDFAKSGCEMRARGNDPCISDPVVEVRDFEAQLRTFFAGDPLCHGVVLADYHGPQEVASKAASNADTSNADWQLMLDFNVGESSQSWTLVHHAQTSTGAGDPKDVVHTVCAVVKQTGGSVAN